MKDKGQKKNALRYCVSKRWLPQIEVDVQPIHALARRPAPMTDLDVFAAIPDDFEGFRHAVFDCKTLARESAVNRSMWLRGVLDRMSADFGVCILKKDAIDADHKLMATRLSVILLGEDEFEIFAHATSRHYDSELGHVSNIVAWDAMFSIPTKYPALSSALQFSRSGYWMLDDAGEACRKCIALLQELRGEFDPAKSEHVALAVDLAALFARSIAQLASYLFRAFLHPKSQAELEEAAKLVLYGGRDAYEHRNQLYRLIKERTSGDTSTGELALPEWSRFIQLVRQLLDSPPGAAHSALILREVAFSYALGESDLRFAKLLCEESPQAGRFAVLILSYLFKASRIPPQFAMQVESQLLVLLGKAS